ncbi:MAG: OmpA family protein [Desulfobacter sp.]|nr:MAG: OmpA family protein [Desulfobacter sp.]
MKNAVLLFAIIFLCACGSKTTVILLPEEDGRTGKVVVKNQASETVLDQPYTCTDVSSAQSALETKPVARETVSSSFKELFRAEPPKPVHFILYFKHNTTTLTDDSLKLIPRVIETAREREPSQISVIGHTDTKGSAKHNIQLSMERAKVVADHLKSSGIELKNLSVTSHGENELLVPTADNVSEPKNRRVEIMVR